MAARATGENFYVLYENDPSPFWKPGRYRCPGSSGRGLVTGSIAKRKTSFSP